MHHISGWLVKDPSGHLRFSNGIPPGAVADEHRWTFEEKWYGRGQCRLDERHGPICAVELNDQGTVQSLLNIVQAETMREIARKINAGEFPIVADHFDIAVALEAAANELAPLPDPDAGKPTL